MKLSKLTASTALFATLLHGIPSTAEDIDIFNGIPPTLAGNPNILIIVDNTANWTPPFSFEMTALKNTVDNISSSFNLGIMMFTETGTNNPGNDGSYIRAAARAMSSANKTALSNLVNNFDVTYDKGNKALYGKAMQEAYLYFKGGAAYAGGDKYKRDYNGNVLPINGNNSDNNPKLAYSNAIYALAGNAFSSSATTTYTSPINSTNNCAKSYIVFISNGPAADNASDTSTATTALSTAGGSTTTIALTPNGEQDNVADEWARFLANSDIRSDLGGNQQVITYTIDVNPGTTGMGPSHTALLKSMANQGRGRYFVASDQASLSAAFSTILSEIQDVNSVFSSVSLPVTVNVRGSYLNQVYMGVFRPNADALPRWIGNLKEYKLKQDVSTGSTYLADSTGNPIEDSATGFIKSGAVSYWTTTSSFWSFSPSGSGGNSDKPDGNIVEKGAAAQMLRTDYATAQSGRNVYTCYPSASCTSGTSLSGMTFTTGNSNITATDLGLGSALSVTSLTRSSTTATATVTAHGYSTGDYVTMAGANQSAYNGLFSITVTGANTFTYSVLESPASPDSGSSITAAKASAAKSITSLGNGSGGSALTATATVTAHGYSTGDTVKISGVTNYTDFNGTFTITVTGANTFTYTLGTSPGNNKIASGTMTATKLDPSKSITSLTRSSSTATATTSTAHGYSAGNTVVISGATGTEYNGTYTIASVPSTTTFTYTITTGPASPATGTITARRGFSTRDDLINWVRGQDNLQDENANTSYTDVRASIHGDVLHSRPAVINYDAADPENVYVFYGANDGLLHAIRGGQTNTSAGHEQWSLIFPEFFTKLDRLRADTPLITTSTPKPYFVDGPISVYTKDGDSPQDNKLGGTNDIARLFLGMRRGGTFLYALDVNSPTSPKFLWKKTRGDTGYGELGQTWSEPKPVTIKSKATSSDASASERVVLIFGGGYDTAEDSNPANTDTMGRAIYVVDASTGTVIWQAGPSPVGGNYTKTVSGMTYSIPADLTVLDRDNDGYMDRIYATDTGGNVWRVNIGDGDPANWTVTKLASLGGSGTRKFLYGASVVYADAGRNYDAVLVGTGNRENPLNKTSADRFYMIKDTDTSLTSTDHIFSDADCPAGNSTTVPTGGTCNFYNATANLIQVGTAAEQAAAQTSLNAANGWYVNLQAGEKVINQPVTVLGTTFFGTNLPTDPDLANCTTSLGEARLYALNFLDASATLENGASAGLTTEDRYWKKPEGGLLPSFFAGAPNSECSTGTSCEDKPIVCTGPHCVSPPGSGRRYRVYWHEQVD